MTNLRWKLSLQQWVISRLLKDYILATLSSYTITKLCWNLPGPPQSLTQLPLEFRLLVIQNFPDSIPVHLNFIVQNVSESSFKTKSFLSTKLSNGILYHSGYSTC